MNISFGEFERKTRICNVTIKNYVEHGLLTEGLHYTKKRGLHNTSWTITALGEKKVLEIYKRKKRRIYLK